MATRSKPEAKSAGPSRGVDLAEIERLLGFMDKHALEEFEYERNGVHVRLKKASAHGQGAARAFPTPDIVVPGGPGVPAASAALLAGPAGTAPSAPREAAAEPGRAEDLHVVKSPIVGTYYGSPSPGAEPFVTVGAHVEPGQVLCIIEAMKLMNEIESDAAGEVVRIFVENGQPVEYGEPLFGIHPHRKK
jgi:acetyl-CoA carboxylase biotin carboxyl carrier protein